MRGALQAAICRLVSHNQCRTVPIFDSNQKCATLEISGIFYDSFLGKFSNIPIKRVLISMGKLRHSLETFKAHVGETQTVIKVFVKVDAAETVNAIQYVYTLF